MCVIKTGASLFRCPGYVKDLADLLMNSMNLTYTLQLVNDSKYGAEDSKSPFGWNGMVRPKPVTTHGPENNFLFHYRWAS